LPVGVLAGALFATNVIARWVVLLFAGHDDKFTTRIGVAALVTVAAVTAVAAFWWARPHPMSRVARHIALGTAAGCLLSVLLSPLLVGTTPFQDGVDFFINQIVYFLAVAVGGAVFGVLVVMALGQDYKSQSWKRYTEQLRAKPRRVVRR
jgi:MFS family permease